VTFHLTQRNLQYWNTASNRWATSTGSYGISVGDSSASLPLSGNLSVSPAQLGQPVAIASPGPQEDITGSPVSLAVSASNRNSRQSLSYAATGLPAGLSVSPASGTITGLPTTPGTSTVTLTARDSTGAFATTTFTWTVVSGLGAGITGRGN
jgi:beta-glucosidase